MIQTPENKSSKVPTISKETFSTWKVLLPIGIGLSVVVLMFLHDAHKENLEAVWKNFHFSPWAWFCVFLGFCAMFGRDFGLSWRFRELTDKQLTWGEAFKVDFLCEFTSCVTPSAVGGSSLGMVFLNSMGIEFGRATTLMLTTLFLDELFFVVACPIIILFTTPNDLFTSGSAIFAHGLQITFWSVYAVIFVWTALLFVGIIFSPDWMRGTLKKVCSIGFLRRFQPKAVELGDNMVLTSKELKQKKPLFWFKVFGGTALSWTSRFLVVNALFLGFIPSADPHQWVIFAREFVIWVVLMVSPTPGGSGLSEWLFSEYYGDLVTTAGVALILAIFWRIISYYVYLLIGAALVPEWLRKTILHFKSTDRHTFPTEPVSGQSASDGTPISDGGEEKNKGS